LQLGEKTHADIEKSDLNIIDASAFINDLSDTAALLTNLDLLITVDSAPAHLAGALNLPVWILITQVPDWRWLLMRNDSIWYESCLLFRQAQNSDWVSVLQDIKMSLKQLNISNENKMNQIISTEPAEHVLVELTQLYNQNDTETCEKLALKLVEQYPEHGFAWKVMGALLQKQGRIKESLSAKQKAAKLLPNDAEVHSNLGSAELLQGLFEEAEQSCRRALALNPLLVSAHNNLGLILQKLGQYSGAEECFRKVLDIGQKTSENFCNLGNALQAQDKFTEAEDNYQQALLLNADYLDAHNNLGVIFKKSGKLSRSEQSYRRVVELNPNDFDSHNNLGIILQEMNNLPEAEAAYQRALELAPNNANIHCNLGNIFLAKHQHQEAMQSYRNALISTPDNAYALSQCVYIDRMLCNWHSINEDNAKLLTYIEKKVASVLVPFGILATPIANAQHQKKSAELHADFRYKSKLEHLPYVKEKTYGHTKLRIGYLSADMHSHATVRLLAGVLENRNTQAFITHIYSYGPNKEDEGRSRMEAACEHFHEVSWLSDEAIAKQIVADEIDILVDLKGYTQDGRLGITALRPAPVIVSWLGYPGTLGHPKLADYIIGDPTVTPLEHAEDFSETLALMPHCYQPNDDKRELGAPPNRKDVGLPLTGFVFCSFNQPYKITPETFSVWCRLLVAVPDSVLWIMALFPDTQANLKAEVQKYDIDPNRLIFAPPMLLTSHLGRLQLADLALDTFPYTSHTTASDALWAGVPLVTKMGDTFASRVAASILNTMDLAELVTTNDEDYFNVALSLAQNHKKLAAIKQKIAEQKPLSPLFDTPKFARDLERLYLTIWEQELSGDRKAIYLESCEQAAGNPNYLKNKGDVKHKTRMVTAKKITKDLKQCNHIEQDKFSSLRKQFEYCPLCKSQRSTILLTSDSQSHALYNSSLPSDLIWLKCSDCYHVFTKYYWTPEGLSKIFYNVDERQIAGGNIDQKRQTWKPVIQNVLTVLGGYSILPTTPPYLTWLDIGCGDGSLVMIAAEFGFNATGLDARAQTVKALNDIGYQAIQGDFMSIEIDESPFVISMMDVLEHLQNPCEALQHIHSLLHPKGVLVISLPNSDSASWKLMDKNNPYWIEFEHYHNFSRQRLIELLNLYGFNVVHYDIPFRYKAQMELYAMKKIEW
jgi:predicted O-linked N-acetylglucosamine transferase (SPINDLY family)/SAM-dependent methyltransferase